jgi:putative tryptophan/tyrosine transport system substrate-binding protein
MRRREFVALLGGAAAAWPFEAVAQQRAQQPGKVPTIGFLGAAAASLWRPWTDTFVQRLGELGWIDGRTVAIEYRWAEGRSDRYAEIAAEFVRLKVDIIVTSTTTPAVAVREATSTIPIVVASITPDAAPGLVASLARPGGNVTGLSPQNADLAGKRLELLREVVPNLRRLAYMTNAARPDYVYAMEMDGLQAAARTFGLEMVTLKIRHGADITPAFEGLKSRADALFVSPEPLAFVNRVRINTLALGQRLPTMHGIREYVDAGGLMSYGANLPEMFRRCADYVDKILRGAKPADLPIEQATRFDLVLNLTTAKALGLDVPPTLLARADEVIE